VFLATVYLWYLRHNICSIYLSMITAVFRNSEFATTLFQVHRCIPKYLAAIPIPPETHITFYIPFSFLIYAIVTFPSRRSWAQLRHSHCRCHPQGLTAELPQPAGAEEAVYGPPEKPLAVMGILEPGHQCQLAGLQPT
jgi:hypothetical protein